MFRRSKRLSSVPQEGPSKRAREMSLGGGAGSGDEESSNVSTVEHEGRNSFVFADCPEVLGAGLFSFCPRCLVAGCISGRRVRIADDVSSDAIFDVPGVSQDDDGVTVVGASSSKVVHERTQHNRPAEGLEASVLHNEWEKG